jgi:hypothetical protein
MGQSLGNYIESSIAYKISILSKVGKMPRNSSEKQLKFVFIAILRSEKKMRLARSNKRQLLKGFLAVAITPTQNWSLFQFLVCKKI